MQNSRLYVLITALMATLLFGGVFASLSLDSDAGNITVASVSIVDGEFPLSGLLYKPRMATADSPAPMIVIAHGICGSKEMMSGIGLELARKGFVTLCLDLLGHGQSQGTIESGRLDPSFGVSSAVQYLKSQPFVNSSAIGLVGHSLGAGAARAAAVETNGVDALVLIAGGFGDQTRDVAYSTFNSTFPNNLLVIVGKYDVLFDIAEFTQNELPLVFGANQKILPSILYGSFASHSARKFVSPSTSHLFESLDSTVVSEIVLWMENAFGEPLASGSPFGDSIVYFPREASIAVALVGLLGLIFLLLFPIRHLLKPKVKQTETAVERTGGSRWRMYVCWGATNLVLFVPMFAVGSLIPFPPLVFGASVAWWLLATGVVGLLLLAIFSKRIFGVRLALKEEIAGAFTKEGAFLTFTLFLALVAVIAALDVGLDFRFRIITPILRSFSPISRAFVFPTFIPFLLPYFLAEGLYIHRLTSGLPSKHVPRGSARDFAFSIFGKISPFVLLIGLQYTLKLAFDVWLLPSFVGFLLEFVWLIVPIFAIATSFSWWFQKHTGNALSGALFNALLMSWVAAVVFPF